jgi:Undecaprenyl-phosphate glucose phosphotransferase
MNADQSIFHVRHVLPGWEIGLMQSGGMTAVLKYVDEEVVKRLLKVLDFVVFFTTALILSTLFANQPPVPNQGAIIGFFALEIAFLCVFIIRDLKLYEPQFLVNGRWIFGKTASSILICGFATFTIVDQFFMGMNQVWLPWWAVITFAYLGVTRFGAQLWARPISKLGRFRKRIAIVGGGKAAEDALQALEASRNLNFEIVGLFDDRYDARSPHSIRKHEKIGKIAELASYARSNRVDLIIVAIPLSAELRLLHILKRLWELPVDIRISGQASSLKLSPRAYTYIGMLPLLSVFDRPLHGWGLFLKNVMERALACVALVVLSPVMLGVAIAIRMESDGPAIFKQKRYGFNNELVEVFKFRSMFTNLTDANATKLVTKGDPRVTRVGRFIRKTSLDELPQLFNVLTGQLSLVGPRPHATQAKAADTLYEQVVDGYFARHKVRPGITGWAQINGWRGETDTREKLEQRVKHDLEYIDRWSLMFDMMIILKTPFALLKSENAY